MVLGVESNTTSGYILLLLQSVLQPLVGFGLLVGILFYFILQDVD